MELQIVFDVFLFLHFDLNRWIAAKIFITITYFLFLWLMLIIKDSFLLSMVILEIDFLTLCMMQVLELLKIRKQQKIFYNVFSVSSLSAGKMHSFEKILLRLLKF